MQAVAKGDADGMVASPVQRTRLSIRTSVFFSNGIDKTWEHENSEGSMMVLLAYIEL